MHTDQTEIDFDEEWYLLTYPDVVDAVRAGEINSGLQHYLSHGRDEGREPHAEFDAAWYVKAYPAVTDEIGSDHPDALERHYRDRGRHRGYLPYLPGRRPRNAAGPFGDLTDLLGPGPIREIRLDLTTRCNLRCVYCAVSQPWYNGNDMGTAILQKAVPAILKIVAHNKLEYFSVAGHGETTFMPGWTEVVGTLIETGLPATLTSNLAKEYSDEELRVLGRLEAIAVSIDTCDRELLRRMRRHVDVRQIATNINLIRAAALDRPPRFSFLSGLYDQNSLHLEAFSRFAVALGIEAMSFWDLSKYDYEAAKIPERDRPRPLDELSQDELRLCLECIAGGFQVLRAHRVEINVHGDFIYRLADKVGMHV